MGAGLRSIVRGLVTLLQRDAGGPAKFLCPFREANKLSKAHVRSVKHAISWGLVPTQPFFGGQLSHPGVLVTLGRGGGSRRPWIFNPGQVGDEFPPLTCPATEVRSWTQRQALQEASLDFLLASIEAEPEACAALKNGLVQSRAPRLDIVSTKLNRIVAGPWTRPFFVSLCHALLLAQDGHGHQAIE